MKLLYALILVTASSIFSYAHNTPYQSIEKRVTLSDIVFEGEVTGSETMTFPNRKSIYTKHTVKIHKVFKGRASSNVITVYTKGGKLNSQFHMHSHAAFLSTGYKGLFFTTSDPYPHISEREFDGVRLTLESAGFIQYTDNIVGTKAVDSPHTYFQNIESVYDSIYLTTKQPYAIENRDGTFSFSAPCPPTHAPEIIFSFENIALTELGTYLEFDIMAHSNTNGIPFGGTELTFTYPSNVFGTNIVQQNILQIEKGKILEQSTYTLVANDLNANQIKIAADASQFGPALYTLSTVKESLCHIKMAIENPANLANTTANDFQTTGGSYYYCGQDQFPFETNIIPIKKITINSPENATGLTYTFENIQVFGGGNNFLRADIYAFSSEPTFLSGGYVKIRFNTNALAFGTSTNGFGFSRGEIVSNLDVYTTEFLQSTQPNIIEIDIDAFEPENLYLLDQTPKKFASVVLDIIDCTQPIGLEFLGNDMQGKSDYYNSDLNFFEDYDPINANDTDITTTCGCENPPDITGYSPDVIVAGMREVLTINGNHFGTYNSNYCKVVFPDGDEGGAAFSAATAEIGDIISWTNTRIELYVPSATGGHGAFKHPACSGRVTVVNDCGEDKTNVNKPLDIPYSVFNVRDQSITNPASLLTIANVTNGTSLEFRYSTQIPDFIKGAFESALAEWCSITNISFTISKQEISLSESDSNDGISTITLEPFAGSGQGALVVGSAYFEECINPKTGKESLYMSELDFKINEDASDFQKVKNVMLHELGHAHMLQHSFDSDAATGNNYLMFHALTQVNTASIKPNDAMGAELVFSNSQEILGGLNCAVPISKGNCGNTTATENIIANDLITFFPNPSNGNFTVQLSDGFAKEAHWSLHDIAGKEISSDFVRTINNQFNVKMNSESVTGIYLLQVITNQGIFSKKIIITE